MRNRTYIRIAAAMALVLVGACSPDEYPTEPRFEVVPDEEPTGHLFVYNVLEDQPVTSVTIPGTVAEPNWNPEESPELENTWMVTVDLPAGTHEYKYVFNDGGWAGNMCDEGTWGHPDYNNFVDPNGQGCVDGGENAVIEVAEAGPHTFMYIVPEGAPEITQLHVAGSFQGWDPEATPMRETYALWMDLDPGTYEYKFFFNGEHWATNMCNDETWGDPDNGYMVDANGQGCVDGGDNALLTID
ncbi:MAG: hypothetical protein ACOC3J_00720 [Gemmatimonadota bacterium]